MSDKSVKVQVRGLPELRRAFKAVSADIPKELGRDFKAVAVRVAAKVAGKVPRRTGAAAGSIKGGGGATRAYVSVDVDRVPYYPFLDFGGSVGRGHKPGEAWSGAVKRKWMGVPAGKGRYLYPTILDSVDEIMTAAGDAVERAAERAGFEVK